MDLPRFLSMLARQSLWFARSDQLGDPHEGSFGAGNVALRPIMYPQITAEALDALSNLRRRSLVHYFVNCWHESPHESMAMWQLYGPARGIAILANLERLRDAIDTVEDVYVGKVEYVDYGNSWISEASSFEPFVHKRVSFEHEREVRAIIHRIPTTPHEMEPETRRVDWSVEMPLGIEVPVRLDKLLSEVRVSPDSPSWMVDAIRNLVARYGLAVSVHQSDLASDPVF